MISAETITEVEKRKWKYILGVRMRSSTEPNRWWRAPDGMRKCIPQRGSKRSVTSESEGGLGGRSTPVQSSA